MCLAPSNTHTTLYAASTSSICRLPVKKLGCRLVLAVTLISRLNGRSNLGRVGPELAVRRRTARYSAAGKRSVRRRTDSFQEVASPSFRPTDEASGVKAAIDGCVSWAHLQWQIPFVGVQGTVIGRSCQPTTSFIVDDDVIRLPSG